MPGWAVIGTPERAVEEPVWTALRAATSPASVRDLHGLTGAHPNSIQHRLSRWVSAGLVARIDGKPKRYAMNDNTAAAPIPPRVALDGTIAPRAATGRARLWRALRVLGRFDLPTLQIASGTTRRSAEDFVNCLQRAGYLRRLTCGNSMRGTWSTYSLIRNSGPKPPVITARMVEGKRLREVVDGNTGARVDISPAAASLRRKSKQADADGGVG